MTEMPVDAIRERMNEIGGLLVRLAENGDLLAELASAVEEEDVRGFQAALQRGLSDFELPPDTCHPYVQVLVLVIKPAKFVWRCSRNARIISPRQGEEIASAIATGGDLDGFIEMLQVLRLLRCKWELEDPNELLVVEKYVQGICP